VISFSIYAPARICFDLVNRKSPIENGKWFWKGCKPNSVCALASGENHLSQQPIPGIRFTFAKPGAGRSGIPYLALHPMGFSVPRRLRFARCALTAPFHHHSLKSQISNLKSQRAVCFLWHCPSETFISARVYHCLATVVNRRYKVTRHRALWCSDFPPPARAEGDSPPFQNQFNYKVAGGRWQVARKACERMKNPCHLSHVTGHGFTPPPPGPCRGCNIKSGRS
jgi:hypothetical protein